MQANVEALHLIIRNTNNNSSTTSHINKSVENLRLKSIDPQVNEIVAIIYKICPGINIKIQTDFFADVRVDGPQNKLNVHAQEFQMGRSGDHLQSSRSSIAIFPSQNHHVPGILQHSKSSGNMQHLQYTAAAARQHAVQMANMNNGSGGGSGRQMMMAHPMQLGPIGAGVPMQSSQMPLVNSPSSGNLLHVSCV